MTAYINKLKDKDSNQQLPITHERAVRDDNGTTAETKFQNLEGAMDKAYVAQSDNGMGRITLHKNIVSGVNTLTQSMMQATNTIYVIRYDFTLAENITVPANCVLEFDGGAISGAYNLTGNDTCIVASSVQIFSNDVLFSGNYNCEIDCSWFGLKYNIEYDNAPLLNKALDLAYRSTNKYVQLDSNSVLYIDAVNNELPHPFGYMIGGNVQIKSGVTLDLNGSTIQCITNNADRYNIIYAGKDDENTNTQNITIKNGTIKGDLNLRTTNIEQGYGIALLGVHGFILENLTIEDCSGDGIFISANALWINPGEENEEHLLTRININGVIDNCKCQYNYRNGMSLDAIDGLRVFNSIFSNNNGISPKAGVDLECEHSSKLIKNILLEKCAAFGNQLGFVIGGITKNIDGITFKDCLSYDNSGFNYTIGGSNITLQSANSIRDTNTIRIYKNTQNCKIKNCIISYLVFNGSLTTEIEIDNCNFITETTQASDIIEILENNNAILNVKNSIFDVRASQSLSNGTPIYVSPSSRNNNTKLTFDNCEFKVNKRGHINISAYEEYMNCRFSDTIIYILGKSGDTVKFNKNKINGGSSSWAGLFHLIDTISGNLSLNLDGSYFYDISTVALIAGTAGDTINASVSGTIAENYVFTSGMSKDATVIFSGRNSIPIYWNGSAWVNIDGSALS